MKSIRFRYFMGGYSYVQSGYSDLNMLGAFLRSDVGLPGNYGSGFRKWIYDDQYEDVTGNFSFLEKEGDKIIIGCQFWSNDPYEWTFGCSKQQLAYILDRWVELTILRPKEIIIIYDGETYFVEGRDFPEQNK